MVLFWRMVVRTAIFSLLIGLVLVNIGAVFSDFYFGQTLRSVLGNSGQYELLLAIRQGSLAAAQKRMQEIKKNKLPGVSFHRGTSLPGKDYYFVDIPEKYQTQDFWSDLDSYFGDIPGKVGYSVLLEPRLIIRGMPRLVLEKIKGELETNLPKLRFAFREGSGLVLAFFPEADLNLAEKKTENILQKYSLLTLYFSKEREDIPYLNNRISDLLQKELNLQFVLPVNNQNQDLLALERVENFFLAYSPVAAIALKKEAILAPGDKILTADKALLQVIEIGDTWARAVLLQGDLLKGSGVYKDQSLLGKISGISSPLDDVKLTLSKGRDFIEKLEIIRDHGLEILAKEDHNWQEAEKFLLTQNWTVEKQAISNLEKSLPKAEDLGMLLTLLQEYQVQQSAGSVFLVSSNLAEKQAEKILKQKIDDQVRAVKSPIGAIEIDLRGEMQRLIHDVREVIAFLLAVIYFLAVFLLDQSMICRYLQLTKDKRKWHGLSSLYGVIWGLFFLPLLIWGSGGNLPYFPWFGWFILGGLVGYLLAGKSSVFTPLNLAEIEAGLALGLNDAQIFNQIVIPEGKPGFFKLLFWSKILFFRRRKNAGD